MTFRWATQGYTIYSGVRKTKILTTTNGDKTVKVKKNIKEEYRIER